MATCPAPGSSMVARARGHRHLRQKWDWSFSAHAMLFLSAGLAIFTAVKLLDPLVNPPGDSETSEAAAVAEPTRPEALPPRECKPSDPRGSGSSMSGPLAAAASADLPPEVRAWMETGEVPASISESSFMDAPAGSPGKNPFVSSEPLFLQNRIDELVYKKWIELGIEPAKLCSDEVYLRRVYLDVLGTLPTVEEARRFLDDKHPEKRANLVDEVLERPEFADYQAMRWCDVLRVKAEFPINLWPNAAQAYHRWIRTAIWENMPCDVFVRELLTASGSNFRTPQVHLYRAVESNEPKALAQAVALTLLCERAESWPAEELDNLSVFFSQVGYKPTGEWKEEIVYFDPRKGAETAAAEPLSAVLPDGSTVEIPVGQDPRVVFADWLLREENPRLSRAIANRVWYWLTGHGIVHPPDDIRPDNPASNPALLNHLAGELVASGYDMKHLYRTILNSHTYQLSCIPSNVDTRGEVYAAYYHVRRLDAEVLIDAICQITGTTETYSSIIPEPFTWLPDDQRAIALPDGSITSSFLEMFGRPSRDTGLESDRNNNLSAAQALYLLNSNHLRGKLKQGPALQELISRGGSPRETAELLYLAILSRRPTPSELSMVSGYCSSQGGAQDIAWALINSDEFLFRH